MGFCTAPPFFRVIGISLKRTIPPTNVVDLKAIGSLAAHRTIGVCNR